MRHQKRSAKFEDYRASLGRLFGTAPALIVNLATGTTNFGDVLISIENIPGSPDGVNDLTGDNDGVNDFISDWFGGAGASDTIQLIGY